MNNRDALLAAARRCLYEKGYQRTTARDIASEADVSLAAIGYHFGSKEALLNAALIEGVGEWGNELGRALATVSDVEDDPLQRFEFVWTRVIELFEGYRQMWKANFELILLFDDLPEEVRTVITDAQQMGREGIALLIHGLTQEMDPRQMNTVGAFYQALLLGLMSQWLVAPQYAPTGRELADALRFILRTVDESSVPDGDAGGSTG